MCIPVYSGVFRCIPVYFGVFRCLVGPPELSGFYTFFGRYSDFKVRDRLTHGDNGPRSQMEGLQNGLARTHQ